MSDLTKKRGAKEAPAPLVILRKVRARGGGHHGGAWKVAYADFVTTMMALFIVLWAASQSPNVRKSIADYFRNPAVVPSGAAGSGVLPEGTGAIGRAEAQPNEAAADAESRSFKTAADSIREEMDKEPDLRALRDQVRIEITPEGLRIHMVERDENLLFEVGSAQIKPALAHLLAVAAQVLGRLPNTVAVEGHTDTRPYSQGRQGYSNWELSADRANSARRVLEASGLRAGQVTRVVGYADRDLLVPTDPRDAQNRRVSIIVRRAVPVVAARPPAPFRDVLRQLEAEGHR